MRIEIKVPVELQWVPPSFCTFLHRKYCKCLHRRFPLQTCKPFPKHDQTRRWRVAGSAAGRRAMARRSSARMQGEVGSMHTGGDQRQGRCAEVWLARRARSLLNLCRAHGSDTWSRSLRPHCVPPHGSVAEAAVKKPATLPCVQMALAASRTASRLARSPLRGFRQSQGSNLPCLGFPSRNTTEARGQQPRTERCWGTALQARPNFKDCLKLIYSVLEIFHQLKIARLYTNSTSKLSMDFMTMGWRQGPSSPWTSSSPPSPSSSSL